MDYGTDATVTTADYLSVSVGIFEFSKLDV